MSASLGPLENGDRVVIIGGGPGGTGCALALERLAAAVGRQVEITIVEGKQFTGERHYNQCVGVLSPPLPALLVEELDTPFPTHLSRGQIEGYVLHTEHERLLLRETGEPSIAVRRVQFDDYMLGVARSRGIAVLLARVVDLEFHADQVVVYTENASLVADVVVGAFGLDEGSAAIFRRLTDHRPPEFLSSVVTKYHPGPAGMATIGPYIHAFLPADPRIEFGAITPKGNHLTINIAGRSVDVPLMQGFMAQPAVRAVLPNLELAGRYDPHDLRFFKGRFPCSLAHGYYGDRYVMVGDAAGLVRAFKGKGVTSALLTGIRAAKTMLQAGISRQAFHEHYRAANQDIIQDLPYGRGMRLAAILMARYGLLDVVVRAARTNPSLQVALFDAVSAHASYKEIVARSLHPKAVRAVLRNMLQTHLSHTPNHAPTP